jgi:hypothetical protein
MVVKCSPMKKSALDATTPSGIVFYLLPLFFPNLKPSDSKAVKSFFIVESNSGARILGKNINITVPFSTNLENLTAEFHQTGGRVKIGEIYQISGETKNNFSNPLKYTIIAQNQTSSFFTVFSDKGSPSSNNLLSFSLAQNSTSEQYSGLLSGNIVEVFLPNGTDLGSLVTFFSHDGKSLNVNGVTQKSGSSIQNFTSTLNYSVISELGTTQSYAVNAFVGTVDSKDIKAFWLNASFATITDSDITVSLPFGTDLRNLIPNFIHTGVDIRYNGRTVLNGETTLDCTNPATITVFARDGSTKNYRVRVSLVSETVSISGTTVGLGTGLNLGLTLNGTESLTINSNGSFNFKTTLPKGSNYTIHLQNIPAQQACTLSNHSGTANGNVTNVVIACNYLLGFGEPPNFTDLGNGTIKDNNTGLTWMKCSIGTSPGVPLDFNNNCAGTADTYRFCRENDNDCNGGSNTGSYGDLIITGFSGTHPGSFGNTNNKTVGSNHFIAFKACQDANSTPVEGFAGRTNWRVPTLNELNSLLDLSSSPTTYTSFFPNTATATGYWTSTVISGSNSRSVNFSSGNLESSQKSFLLRVRCVSGP